MKEGNFVHIGRQDILVDKRRLLPSLKTRVLSQSLMEKERTDSKLFSDPHMSMVPPATNAQVNK